MGLFSSRILQRLLFSWKHRKHVVKVAIVRSLPLLRSSFYPVQLHGPGLFRLRLQRARKMEIIRVDKCQISDNQTSPLTNSPALPPSFHKRS